MDVKAIQRKLGVKADGDWGPITWASVFELMGCKDKERARALGIGMHKYARAHRIDNAMRICHFMAQAAHETGGFRWMEEIWGPTPAQRRYEGRADLGNTQKGDGFRFKGRGIFQLTGRDNYTSYGKKLGLDLVGNPELAADPETSVLIACRYWRDNGLNELADDDRAESITRRINGGLNGFADRVGKLCKLKELLL